MASPALAQFLSLPRWHSSWPFFPSTNLHQIQDLHSHKRWNLMAVSRKKNVEPVAQEVSEDGVSVEKKTTKTSKRSPGRRKKVIPEALDEDNFAPAALVVDEEEANVPSASNEEVPKKTRRTRKKAESTSSGKGEDKVEKKTTRRRARKKVDTSEEERSDKELSDGEGDPFIIRAEDELDDDLELGIDEDEDISSTYGWPPLVCCFGAAQHAFVPAGRPSNRLVDYERQERMKNALWAPEKFVRAPGGCATSVAVALASLGGKVAFMGKVGDDDYGQAMLYYLNFSNVQTRSICIDSKRITATSQMKISKRGALKMTCVKPCAEDLLSRSEINIDVLKEAKMFYFNTFPLLDRNMRSTTLRAINISKKLGGLIFYDLNLPLPLWRSSEETKAFIQQLWNLADIIEVTKQELEFLCGICPTESFDTRDNDRSKFVHHEPEVLAQLWHENLKVLFVTNGTSKIHYYTKDHDGYVLGMEDVPISPYTCDMSASGDGIVAALLRMLSVQPHRITDKGYLEHTIKYAINCGVIDQWLQTRIRGFPPREGMEEDVEPDQNGIRSITEREYRTLGPDEVGSMLVTDEDYRTLEPAS